MSLINDALKKAQKQRNNDGPAISAMPGVGGQSASQISRSTQNPGVNMTGIFIGLGAVMLLVLVAGGFLVGRWMASRPEVPAAAKPTAVVAQATPPPAASVAATPAAVPIVVEKLAASNPPATSQPAASTAVPASTPAKIAAAPAPVATPPVVASSTVDTPAPTFTVPPAPVAPAPTVIESKPILAIAAAPTPLSEGVKPSVAGKLDSKALIYIDGLRVAAIKTSATEAKVLMNDRVYRIGDTVEHILGLKLAAIAPNALTFEDERGVRFTRNF